MRTGAAKERSSSARSSRELKNHVRGLRPSRAPRVRVTSLPTYEPRWGNRFAYDGSAAGVLQAAKDPIFFKSAQANLFVYVGNDPINYLDRWGLADIPWYIPDQAAINHMRQRASDFGYDISGWSDQKIRDFIDSIPEKEADAFAESYKRRPDADQPTTPAQDAANALEIQKEKEMIEKWLRNFGVDPCTIRKKKK